MRERREAAFIQSGFGHIVIHSRVEVCGDRSDGPLAGMDENPISQPGMQNDPRVNDPEYPPEWFEEKGNTGIFQFIGQPPQRGTIIEALGNGPVIRVFRAKNVLLRNLAIVARHLGTVEIDSIDIESRLYAMLGRLNDPTNPASGWADEPVFHPVQGPEALQRNGNQMWVDANNDPLTFSDLGSNPIVEDQTGSLPQRPWLFTKWFHENGEEYDPSRDDDLKNERNRAREDYSNCALHVNGVWYSTFENLVFDIPRKSVAILVDPFTIAEPNPYHGSGRIYDGYSIFSPYFLNPGANTNSPHPDEYDDNNVVDPRTPIPSGFGSYKNNFQNINATTGLIVVYGNSRGDAVTVNTFANIWARRYVVRFAMAITFNNCTAESFWGNCPAFSFPDPGAMDIRISYAYQNQPNGWWPALHRYLLIEGRQYFDGREMGYLIDECDNIVLVGCDIEDPTGKVCVMLGEEQMNPGSQYPEFRGTVSSFNAIGINTGISAIGSTYSLLGQPNSIGIFQPSSGPGLSWGTSKVEMLTDTPYNQSSDSMIIIGSRNKDAVDHRLPFQYRLRAMKPSGRYPGARQGLELVEILNSTPTDERRLLLFDRVNIEGSYANLITVTAGKGQGDGVGSNHIMLYADRVSIDGEPFISNTTTNGITIPSTVTTTNQPKGWVRIIINKRDTYGHVTEEYAYIPFYQP